MHCSCASARASLDFAGRRMRTAIATAALVLCLAIAGKGQAPSTLPTTPAAPRSAAAPAPGAATVSPQRALIDQYCMGCHSDKVRSGGLALSELDLDAVGQHAEIAEKVIRKLRGGLMPPAGVKRPDSRTAAAFVSWLETEVDAGNSAASPGRVPLRRLNRREYANAIRDLLALNIDAKAWLPDDNVKGHFDNDATALQVSPAFVDQYIYAARAV